MEAGLLRAELHQHRDRPVGLRRRLGEESFGHLPLHHHAPELEPRLAVEALDDHRGRDVVREVRDELRRAEPREVEPESVPEMELDVRSTAQSLPQRPLETGIELDSVHLCHAVGEIHRERAEPWADLEHTVDGLELREAADHAEDVLVDEEVLAELLLRADGHGPASGP